MTDEFDFLSTVSFKLGGDDALDQTLGRRQAFRAVPPGVRVQVHGKEGTNAVNDVSAGGVCMAADKNDYAKGDALVMDVLIVGKCYLSDLNVVVVRPFPGEIACAFQNLTRHQELKLDKLVLEMQKRYIAQRKQDREAQEQESKQANAADITRKDKNAEKPVISIHLPL